MQLECRTSEMRLNNDDAAVNGANIVMSGVIVKYNC